MGPRVGGKEKPVENHVKILGVLHIVCGGLGLLVALIVVFIVGLGALGLAGVAAQEGPAAVMAIPVIGAIGTFVVVLIIILSIPGIAAGFGLLKYRPWARILMVVPSALQLLSFPLGTALGIYGLVVLLNQQAQPLFAEPREAVPPYPPEPPPQPPASQ